MRESYLKLNDRTVVLAGPVSQVTRAIVTILSEQGCDVAMVVSDKIREAQIFADNMNEAREIHHNFGRVAAIESTMQTKAECTESISRVAEIFGSIDILIDTHLVGVSKSQAESQKLNEAVTNVSESTLPYLVGRQKGRIILICSDFLIKEENQSATPQKIVQKMVQDLSEKSITANVISCGITEEYLLYRFDGKMNIKEAFEAVSNEFKNARLIDASEVAAAITFLASPISAGVSGQTLHVNGGLIL